MADIGIRERLLVRDVMTSPVVTVKEDTSVYEVAQQMDKFNIGCVIVTKDEDKPVGIITERDIVLRVVEKNELPSKVKAKEIMSTPLNTIDPDMPLTEAARKMSKLNVRRLGVMYKGKLAGIITGKDILAVTPELIDIIQEKTRLESNMNTEELLETTPLAGYCDRCGRWSSELKEVEGNFLCGECRIELQEEL